MESSEMPNPQTPAPQITEGFIRTFGAIELIGGGIAYYFGKDWSMDGIVPVRWVALFFMAFGAFMEINPGRFLKRAEKFEQMGSSLSKKSQVQ
jgi:hypothetical protein